MPRPSQPINRQIIFGIKINKFIEATNNRTIYVNRRLFLSFFIYWLENFRTIDEIKITIDEYKIVLHSNIRSNFIL